MAMHSESMIALGTTDVRVSPLGVGTNSWGARGGTDPHKVETFNALMDEGITLLDTAEIYTGGASERTIGECVRATGRSPVVLTKFFPLPWRVSRRRLVAALRQSLQRLGLPRVDVYLLHFPWPPVPLETWMEGLADAVQAGLTRAVGISNCGPAQVRRAHAALKARGVPLACNEVELSLLKRAPLSNGLLDVCRELGVTIIAYRPLAQGMLSGKYSPEHQPGGIRGLLYGKGALRRMQLLIETLKDVGGKRGKSVSQVAINWVICKGAIAIPGAKDPVQARENAGAMGWRLTGDEIAILDEGARRIMR
jgi:aryl-alcohol dehydrogenase-like predicted oxidoreductase